MFTLIAYSQSQDSAVLISTQALADPHVRVSGTDIVVPRDVPEIVAVAGLGPNLTRAQLVSPSLRRFLNLEVAPIDVAALPSSPAVLMPLWDDPVVLQPDELLQAQMAENAAGASRGTILVWLADKAPDAVHGDIRTVRVTASTTLVANAWTNGAITFDQSLPAGEYAIVGARFRSTNLQAFRFVFVGGIWRPGAIGYAAVSNLDSPMFRNGNLGEWGRFQHNTPPTVDFLANAADTSEVGELDLIQASGGA